MGVDLVALTWPSGLFLDLWRAGKLDFEGLITETAALDEVNQAFTDMESCKVIRTVLNP